MKHDITKICVISLRAYLRDEYGVKLNSGHGHEIVSAFFGYKSKIALLADTQYPLSNLEKAEFILLNPSASFVDQRIKRLEGISPELPPSAILAEAIYAPLVSEKWISDKIWPTFRDLGIFLSEERLLQRLNMWGITSQSIKRDMVVDIDQKKDSVLLTVDTGHHTDNGDRLKDSKYAIKLQRVAANLGYGRATITETRYSGEARRIDFPEIDRPKNGTAE